MSQMPANAPMMPAGGAPTGLVQTWIKAFTSPNEATYAAIANSPNAKASSAYLWVFLTSLLPAFFAVAISQVRTQLLLGSENRSWGGVAIAVLCGTPIGAAIGTGILALFVAIVQWIAKMFGGKGNFEQLSYAFGAAIAPAQLVSAVLVLLGAIPLVGLCFSLVSFFLGLYLLYLYVVATKAVNQFDWGPAAGSVLIPVAAIFLVCACVVAIGGAVLGESIRQVFNQINQSLPTSP